GLCAATYSVTVTDNKGCSSTATATVIQPATVTVTVTTTNANCGQSDGSATASGSNGIGPYTYLWSANAGSQTTSTATGLLAGSYTVTVSDSKGCTATGNAAIGNNSGPQVTIQSMTNVLCNGGNNGQITVLVTDGQPPYTHTWSNGQTATGVNSTASPLTAGTYSVLITDVNGCITTISATITEPLVLAINATTLSNPTCNNLCDGSASASASGGSGTYTYNWSTGSSGTSVTNICTGTYTVTVTDGNGCTVSSSVNVTQPTALTASVTPANASCYNQCNGSATASASGATPPYTYLWNDPLNQTTISATGLCDGLITVTVTDNKGCTASASGTITEPAQLAVNVTSIQNVNCNGNCNGSIQVSVSNGSAPYTYQWNNGQSNPLATGLCAGNYTVTVSDNKGCTQTASAAITEPTALTLSVTKTDITCYGYANGQATATAGGGTSPYSYQWNDGFFQTTSTATGLTAGIFTITVTDSKGCIITGTTTITEPVEITLSIDTNGSHCGQADGEAIVTVSSGTYPPFTYLWSAGGQTGATATGLASGNYTVTVTDNKGCAVTGTANVSDLGSPALSILSKGDVSCYGACDGFATVLVTGGTSPYTYSWNDPGNQTTATATGLCAGNFTVSIADPNGCTANISVTITQPAQVSVIISSLTPVSCFGDCNGQATTAASGGTPPYSFLWNDPSSQTGSTASALCPGAYGVTAEDANGCIAGTTATITEPPVLSVSINPVSAHCGQPDGSATATASGGNGTYGYSWNNSQAGATAVNLIPGNYTVTATDSKGCTIVSTVTVGDIPAGTATIANVINVSCNGGNNGQAAVSMAGGTVPFTYIWSNGQTGSVATGLAAGSYTVSVTDFYNCLVTATATITEPVFLTVTITGDTVSCSGICDGSVTAIPAGGNSPYSYLWNDPFSQTTASINNLCAGSYSVTVTDNSGCATSAGVIIASPSAINLSEAHVDANCGQDNGSAAVTATGGTPPYSYLWSNGNTNSSVITLFAGTYSVTVSDSKGCSSVLTVTILNQNGPSASITATSNVSCNGGSDGWATVSASGGNPPYSYQWNDPLNQTAPTAANLPAGSYLVLVADSSGCMANAPVTITEPQAIAYNLSVVNPVCYNDSNGSAGVIVTGGTPPYSYLWDDPSAQTTATATGLYDGNFNLIITDDNGCFEIISVTISEPAQLNAFTTSTPAYCYGSCDGTATANPVNGTSPFSYQWNDPNFQATQTAGGLCAGNYSVTVTDAKGCSFITSATITEPTQIVATITSTGNNYCFGECTGFAQSDATGGTPPYLFNWNNFQVTSQAINLCAGTYTVTATDGKGCTGSAVAVITEPQAMGLSMTANNASCYGDCNGNASVSVSGGQPPYTYLWDDPTFQTNATANNLCADVYTVTVTDNNGCTQTMQANITQPAILDFSESATTALCGNPNGEACVVIIGGEPPYVVTWNDPNTQVGTCAYNLYSGVYIATLSDANGCIVSKPVLVNDVLPTLDSLTVTDVTCAGSSNGSATVYVTTAAPPLTFLWKEGAVTVGTGQSLSNIDGGTYTVSVIDTNGCVNSAIALIFEPTPLAAAVISQTNVSCTGSCDGTATAMAGGGVSPYIFLWDLFQTGSSASGLCAGPHELLVTDDNGCQFLDSLTITEPLPITFVPIVNEISCNGVCDGVITLLPGPSGGTPFYTYSWTPNAGSGPTITNLCPNTYFVVVTDIKGCTQTGLVQLVDPSPLGFIINSTPAECGNDNGTASVTPSGGTAPYSYIWQTGSTASTITGLADGIYGVTFTDDNGCALGLSVPVSNIDGPALTVTTFNVMCNGQNTGWATANPTGGTIPYFYLWNDSSSQTTQTATYLFAGIYNIVVTDFNGCTVSQPVVITQQPPLTVIITGDTLICNAEISQLSATGIGGFGQYSYFWSGGYPSQQTITVSPDADSTYTVYITDEYGCRSQNDGVITVKVFPKLEINATVNSVCVGEAATIYTSITSPGDGQPYSYEWLGTSYISQFITVYPTDTTMYTVVVKDGCSKNDTDIVWVFVYPYPQPKFYLNDSDGCAPITIQFNDLSTISAGSSIQSWDWYVGDGQTSALQNPVMTFETPGSYSVTLTVTSDKGCDTSLTVNNLINVYAIPTAYFVPVPDETTLLLAIIQFYDSSSADVVNWSWDFGEPLSGLDNFSTETDPIHTYLDTGTYLIELTVITARQCTARYIDTVIIKSDYVLFVPNAFTPDGDGINETFFPRGIGIDPDNFEMFIYDRWGDEIYHTDDINKPWNGRANKGGNLVQQDVYVWLIRTKDFNGVQHEYIGHVSVIK
ncbi:MAG: gliding motility-associated C-terminal domain-containing protein, partial [Bacteroidetes bacterium]|nr:gliding motility-associated C-terminal domain-containing protein [Bacteroidota bacterium]